MWLDADRVALVDGDAVTVIAVATGQVVARVAGGAGVATTAVGPRRRCDAEPPPFAEPDPAPDDPGFDDADEAPDEAPDARTPTPGDGGVRPPDDPDAGT